MKAMNRIMRRMETGERWWAAEISLRLIGAAMLVLCATTAIWLYHAVQQTAPHDPGVFEYAAALFTVLSWSLGWSLVVAGPGLFKLVEVPPRHRRFTR